MRLVVNIPTYLEEENIEEAIKRVLAQAKALKGWDLHIVVSDSHSPDKTGEIVKRLSKTNSKLDSKKDSKSKSKTVNKTAKKKSPKKKENQKPKKSKK